MTIDTKRLETDAAYWDECGAPEDATHVLAGEKRIHWEKWEDGIIWVYRPGGWEKHNKTSAALFERIPRPTTTAAQEWHGDGLPPVGEEVEASFVSGSMDQYWSKGKVVAHDNGLPVVRVGGVYYGLNLERLRPLRTKEQRQAIELANCINSQVCIGWEKTLEIAKYAISQGWTKEA